MRPQFRITPIIIRKVMSENKLDCDMEHPKITPADRSVAGSYSYGGLLIPVGGALAGSPRPAGDRAYAGVGPGSNGLAIARVVDRPTARLI